jgi:hypothetical protein
VVNDVRHTDIDAGESLVSEPSSVESEKVIETLKKNKTPAADEVLSELV